MSLVEGWYPPSRENYETLLFFWQIGYPIVSFLRLFLVDRRAVIEKTYCELMLMLCINSLVRCNGLSAGMAWAKRLSTADSTSLAGWPGLPWSVLDF
jgi:hypothetical protein